MAKKKEVKKPVKKPIEIPIVFPHKFVCKNCGIKYENADTNSPDCPNCKCQGCADRIG